MPAFKPREVVKILRKIGFIEKRQTGSHLIMYRSIDSVIIPLPIHTKDIKKGLLHGIIKDARSTLSEFQKLK